MENTIEIHFLWAGLAGFAIASWLIAKLPMSEYTGKTPPVVRLQQRLRLDHWDSGVFFLGLLLVIGFCLFWLALFATLAGGLMWTIIEVIEKPLPAFEDDEAVWPWRFSLIKLASLTAVLGAVVAVPFTFIRIWLNRRQVETAKDALFNDKIDAAVTDLYAQRQVTLGPDAKGNFFNAWEDDITRRNGAIDRLEGLVGEDPSLSPRVVRMLSVYVRELSRETLKPWDEVVRPWDKKQALKRSDMEKAVQTLGRLPAMSDADGAMVRPDLERADLRKMNLSKSNFEGANLVGVSLHGSSLRKVNLKGASLLGVRLLGTSLVETVIDKNTVFRSADLRGAIARGLNVANAPQILEHLDNMFGDATVKWPSGFDPPERFKLEYENVEELLDAWRDFQHSIGQDPENLT